MYSSICWYSNSPFYCTTLSMTIHQLIKHIKQWSCFIVKLLNSVLLTCGPTAQTLIFSWLPHLGSDTGMTWMSLSNTNTGCSRSAAEVDEHVSLELACHRVKQTSNWPEAKQTKAITNSCSVISHHKFHDCIKCDGSMIFPTSSYCCNCRNVIFEFHKVTV